MLSFYSWNGSTTEIIFEGFSFYYIHRLPVAFREPMQKFVIFNQSLLQKGSDAEDFYDMANKMNWAVIVVGSDKFKEQMEQAYQKAMVRGITRIGLCQLNVPEEESNGQQQRGIAHE